MTTRKSTAYTNFDADQHQDGFSACKAGQAQDDNPNRKRSVAWKSWNEGWKMADRQMTPPTTTPKTETEQAAEIAAILEGSGL